MKTQLRDNGRQIMMTETLVGCVPCTDPPARGQGRLIRTLPLLAGLLLVVAPRLAAAKSLYVIADVHGAEAGNPIHAYDIGPQGRLTFQAEYTVPYRGLGAIGLALDARSEHLFITSERSNVVALLNPVTMTPVEPVTAPGAKDLAGIVYDHSKDLLY